jgi:hypothetical protein
MLISSHSLKMMQLRGYFISVAFISQIHNYNLVMKTKIQGLSTSTRLVFFKNILSKEARKNSHRSETAWY